MEGHKPSLTVVDEVMQAQTDAAIIDIFTKTGSAAEDATKSVQKFNDVYFSDKFAARERLKEDEYKRRRAKSKAAKKARRKNRGN